MIATTIQLNKMTTEELIHGYGQLLDQNQKLIRDISYLKEQLEWFKRQVFGEKSERIIDPLNDQPDLPMDIPENEVEEPELVVIPEHTKRKPKKGSGQYTLEYPDDLDVEKTIHALSGDDLVCKKTGKTMVEIDREHSDKLACKPQVYYIRRHIYIKYGVPHEPLSGVKQAPAPPCIITGSKFDVSLMASITVEKFAYHMPLNRIQERMLASEVKVTRQTLSSLLINLGDKLRPLYDLMKNEIFASGVIFTDDTPVKMIVKGESKAKKGRMWIYLGGKPNAPPYHIYDFTEDWKHSHPTDFMKYFKGVFHADAYEAYCKIDQERDDLSWAGCWSHARREFERALTGENSDFSLEILRIMRYLFMYERVAWSRTSEDRLAIRQKYEAKLVDELFKRLHEELSSPTLLPRSQKCKAIKYMLGRKDNFKLYLTNPDLRMDNNPAERALRKVCIGKKNWMFVGSAKGGDTAAVLFSLVQTCRAINVNPVEYLEDIYNRLLDHPAKKLKELLPDRWLQIRNQNKPSA